MEGLSGRGGELSGWRCSHAENLVTNYDFSPMALHFKSQKFSEHRSAFIYRRFGDVRQRASVCLSVGECGVCVCVCVCGGGVGGQQFFLEL